MENTKDKYIYDKIERIVLKIESRDFPCVSNSNNCYYKRLRWNSATATRSVRCRKNNSDYKCRNIYHKDYAEPVSIKFVKVNDSLFLCRYIKYNENRYNIR